MKPLSQFVRSLLLVAVLSCAGCTMVTYRDGNHVFTRIALGANTNAGRLVVKISPDGNKVLVLEGYDQKQSEAFGEAARGITEAVITAIKPIP